MSEQMRKEFEEWARKEGYCTALHPDGSGEYSNDNTENLWIGWQASRQALIVELPKGEGDECGHIASLADVEDALDEAGVPYR